MSTPNPERVRRFLDKVQAWMASQPQKPSGRTAPSESSASSDGAEPDEVFLRGNGQFDLEVKGESHYQTEIRAALKANQHERFTEAVLIPEDNNRYDRNAVRIEIHGQMVGYLSREAAPIYREQLRLAGKPGIVTTCRAKIVGGTADKPSFGVLLDVPVEWE